MGIDWEKAEKEEVLEQVIKDFTSAETARKPREDMWRRWYKLYRSYVETKKQGSNIFVPYVFSIIETVLPKLMSVLFNVRPYIGVLATKPSEVASAKAQEELIDYQLTQQMPFKEIMASWIKEALMLGTSILKVGWEYEEGEYITTEPILEIFGMSVGERLVKEEGVIKDDPLIEHIDLWDFYISPFAKNVQESPYAIHKMYTNLEHLKEMEKLGIYEDINEVEKSLASQAYETGVSVRQSDIGLQDAEKPEEEIELLEYWTDARVITVANRAVVIRNNENPYYHRRKPFIRLVDVIVPHEFYGIGEIEPIEHLQHEFNTLRNQRIDNLNLIINRMWKVLRGADIDAKQLVSRAGGIIELDDMTDIEELVMKDVTNSAYIEADTVKRDMDNANGVFDYARGETTDRRETATTAAILSTAASERFQLKVSLIEDMGVKELGRQLGALNQQFITTDRMVRLQGDHGYEFKEIPPEQIRGQFDYMALGSAVHPVINKENRLTSFINLYNMLKDSPHINHAELLKRILELADIKDVDSILVDNSEQAMMQQLFGNLTEEEVMAMEMGEDEAMLESPPNVQEGVMDNERGFY